MFREGNSLLKVGVIMMALALALLIAAGVVRATLRSEPQRVVPAEVATKSPGQTPRYFSGHAGSATKKPSSQKESPAPSSGEESVENGSSSSFDGPVGERKEEYAKEPQALVQQKAEAPNSQSPMPQQGGSKHLLKHPLSQSLNHDSTYPNQNSLNHTNKSSNRCLTLKGGAGPNPPKES